MPPHDPSRTRPPYDHVVLMGVGLIGGSIAKALKVRGLARRVTGLGRNRERLLAAQRAGLLDAVATHPSELSPFCLAVVCTPVDRIPEDVRSLQAVAPASAVITDAGSVKGRICRELAHSSPGQAPYVGSHPMAGSEQGGWEHADAQLFEGKVCAVTPLGQSNPVVEVVEKFWSALGMRVSRFDPDQHDRIVALTSHLPHAAASVIASLLMPEAWPLAATGFKDTTRVASGDPTLWTAILLENREAVVEHLRALTEQLQQLTASLESDDSAQIEVLLAAGKASRDAWLKSTQQ